MALTANEIVDLARQQAKVPGFVTQSRNALNMVLAELCETYDFDVARTIYQFNFNPALTATAPFVAGSGPYALPSAYLRANPNDVFYTILGVPYMMSNLSIAQIDGTVQQSGLANYPRWYATDISVTPPVMYVYPQPSGAYPVTMRYFKRMTDIDFSNTGTAVGQGNGPVWFPFDNYLIVRTAGELMRLAGDARAGEWLSDSPQGAQGILGRILKLANDKSNRATKLTLDPQTFRSIPNLPPSKILGF